MELIIKLADGTEISHKTPKSSKTYLEGLRNQKENAKQVEKPKDRNYGISLSGQTSTGTKSKLGLQLNDVEVKPKKMEFSNIDVTISEQPKNITLEEDFKRHIEELKDLDLEKENCIVLDSLGNIESSESEEVESEEVDLEQEEDIFKDNKNVTTTNNLVHLMRSYNKKSAPYGKEEIVEDSIIQEEPEVLEEVIKEVEEDTLPTPVKVKIPDEIKDLLEITEKDLLMAGMVSEFNEEPKHDPVVVADRYLDLDEEKSKYPAKKKQKSKKNIYEGF